MNYYYDFLVIGSGIAGLNFAISASKYGKVAIITKKELMESNSNYAQGGIAAVIDSKDTFYKHIEDTLKAGCYINDKKAVKVMVKEAPTQIKKLIEYGVGFNRINGKLALTKEGGHSARRIAYVKDATGKEIERALLYNIRNNKNIQTFESRIAVDLIIKNKKCLGAIILDNEQKKINIFYSKATIMATGGCGQVFERNCNPKIATGDGLAMCYRAQAKVKDLEFVQFHPTALAKKGKPTFLISETVRGEGAILKNYYQEAFMENYHPLKELAPRDIVSRAIFSELKKGPVYLDIRHRGTAFIKKRFPYIYNELWWFGILMDRDLIPVAPAAHYICGGINTNIHGETNITGLYAFGEAARTGVHGANRLASNSLLECMVFSSRALVSARQYIHSISNSQYPIFKHSLKINKKINPQIKLLKKQIQVLMWENVGIVRSINKMSKTLAKLENIAKKSEKIYNKGVNMNIIELKNINQVAILITKAALKRKKSIGAHYLN